MSETRNEDTTFDRVFPKDDGSHYDDSGDQAERGGMNTLAQALTGRRRAINIWDRILRHTARGQDG